MYREKGISQLMTDIASELLYPDLEPSPHGTVKVSVVQESG
jgi:hypothetical protein